MHWQKRREGESPKQWLKNSQLHSFRSSSTHLSAGMDHAGSSAESVAAYKHLKAMIGSKMLRHLSETSVGHPETYAVETDYKTNCSDLDLSYFCSQIIQLSPEANFICKIGGGYGGLAHK